MATIIRHGDGFQSKIRRKGFDPVCRTFPTHKLAKEWATRTEAEMFSGKYISRDEAESTTLREALQRYLEEVTPEKAGVDQETYRIRQLQSQSFTGGFLANLRPADFIKYRDSRRKCLRANLSKADKKIVEEAKRRGATDALPSKFFIRDCTVRKELRLISHLFNIARKRWHIPVENPIDSIELPPEGEPRTLRLQDDCLERILLATERCRSKFIKPLVLFLIETGLRRGEALSLRWEDFRNEHQFVYLRKGKNQRPRQIPLSSRAIALIQNLPRPEGAVTLFPVSGNLAKQALRQAIKRAGLAGTGICTHTLRHEACSRLGDLGLSAVQIAGVSGHKTLQLVHRYTHLDVIQLAKKLG